MLFALHVCILREYEGYGNAGVWDGGGVWCGEYRACDGVSGSGSVSSAANVLYLNMVRGMRGFGGVCAMCMCLARIGVEGEGVVG